VTRDEYASEIRSILDRERENGGRFWSRDDGNIHAPAGLSTLLVLNVLGDLGATSATDPAIAGAIDLLFQSQADDGAFRYSATSNKLPCITGQALAALGRLGLAEDERVEAAYRWLLESQWGDGGWRCATVRLGRSAETDASNPGATLFVLDAFRFRRSGRDEERRIAEGVRSLLDHWETRLPLGPCSFGIGSRFLRVEYPFWRYNLFYYVHVLSHFRQARGDRRFLDALQQVHSHTDGEGRMVVDAAPRAWQHHSFCRPGAVSDLATQRWQEIQTNLQTRRR
jgi:hypothetical protein